MNNRLQRDSNAEMLRLLCMLMIVMHHFCVHAVYPEVLSLNVINKGWDSHLMLFLHDFFFIGVNCFVLISGYYGIRPKWRSFINLYSIYVFYVLLGVVGHIAKGLIIDDSFVFQRHWLKDIVFPFSRGPHWFMKCYMALFLLSPLLNKAIANFTKKEYLYTLCFLSIMILYFGYYRGMSQMGDNGYSTLHFVYLYCIGGYMRRYFTSDYIAVHRRRFLALYVGSAVLWGLLTLLQAYQSQTHLSLAFHKAFCYDNILVFQ